MTRTLSVLSIFLITIGATNAFASAVESVFDANQGNTYVGVNTVTGSTCAVQFTIDFSLRYRTECIDLSGHTNYISAGAFHKRLFQRTLYSADSGMSGLFGRFDHQGRLEINYDSNYRAINLSDFNQQGTLINRCVFQH